MQRLWAVFLLAIPMQLSCATRTVERTVYVQQDVTTTLRQRIQSRVSVDRGYQHPVEISEERLRRILAAIVIRTTEDHQIVERPAIAETLLGPVARGLSRSLAVANSAEEVALTAVRRARRLAIFSEKFLTSFVSYARDDLLTISLSRVEWDIDLGKQSRAKRARLPQPRLGDRVMEFSVVPDPVFETVGQQSVQVRWQDDRWDEAGS